MTLARSVAIAALASVLARAQSFRLDSERRDTYGPSGSSSATFTAYDYDDAGHRIAKRSFSGIDAGAPPLGRTDFQYGSDGRLNREITVSGSDTLSDAHYFYTQYPGPERIVVRGAGGVLRYTDTLTYDSRARVVAEGRRNAAGNVTSGRRYAYDAASRLLADTLMEPDGGVAKATQIRALAYNPDGTVQFESHSRLAEGSWFAWKIVHMEYSAGKLASAVTREGGALTDSLAYRYDANGNRVLQDRFDKDLNRQETIAYVWSAVTRIIALPRNQRDPRSVRLLDRTQVRVGARFFDLRGRGLGGPPLPSRP